MTEPAPDVEHTDLRELLRRANLAHAERVVLEHIHRERTKQGVPCMDWQPVID